MEQSEEVTNEIIKTIQLIENQCNSNNTWYSKDRKVIEKLFAIRREETYNDITILTRLTVIDSMYSTGINANNYYALQDMSEAIYKLNKDESKLKKDLIEFVESQKNTSESSEAIKKIFFQKFGLRKAGQQGSRAPSLLSKYFYFLLLNEKSEYGFPIYDSLAKEVFPIVFEKIYNKKFRGWTTNPNELITNYIYTFKELVDKIELNKVKLNGRKIFDAFDAYLWRMGKIKNGSIHFDMTKDEFKEFTAGAIKPYLLNKEYVKNGINKLILDKIITPPENSPLKYEINDYYNKLIKHYNEIIK